MVNFFFAVLLLTITPGPGVLTTAGIGAAFGYSTGLRFLVGLWLSTNLIALLVISGRAATLLSIGWLHLTLLLLSLTYLCYLALSIILAGTEVSFINVSRKPGLLNGLVLQFINPKAYAVNTTLFTGFAFYPSNQLLETAIKLTILNVLWLPVHFAWLAAGVHLKKLALTARSQRLVNIAMGISVLLVVLLALWAIGEDHSAQH